MLQKNKAYCMNCLDGMDLLDECSVDLVFTSPPYYNAKEYSQYSSYPDYLEFICLVINKIHRVLSNDGFFILNTSPVISPRKSRSFESIRYPIPFDTFCIAKNSGFKYIDDIVWEKPDGASNRAIKFSHHRRPMAYKPFAITEYLFVFRKQDAPLIDKGIRKHSPEIIDRSLVSGEYERTNVWKISPSRNKNHPATFPLSLANKVISYYSFVEDFVLDPFSGIGTTLLASKNLQRSFIGFDIYQKYVDLANCLIER